MTRFMKLSAVLSVLGLSVLFLSAPAVLQAADKACVVAKESEFIEQVTKRSPPPSLYILNKVGHDKFLSFVNGMRAKQKLFPLEADKIVLGMLGPKVGIVMFKDGCVVPGTAILMEAVQFMALVKASGLQMEDKDPYKYGQLI